jgi:hypothetical protein
MRNIGNNIQKAIKEIGAMSADMGGTEIYHPL